MTRLTNIRNYIIIIIIATHYMNIFTIATDRCVIRSTVATSISVGVDVGISV
jgi:hypothetical protein